MTKPVSMMTYQEVCTEMAKQRIRAEAAEARIKELERQLDLVHRVADIIRKEVGDLRLISNHLDNVLLSKPEEVKP